MGFLQKLDFSFEWQFEINKDSEKTQLFRETQ